MIRRLLCLPGHIPKLGRGNGEYWPYILKAAREVALPGRDALTLVMDIPRPARLKLRRGILF